MINATALNVKLPGSGKYLLLVSCFIYSSTPYASFTSSLAKQGYCASRIYQHHFFTMEEDSSKTNERSIHQYHGRLRVATSNWIKFFLSTQNFPIQIPSRPRDIILTIKNISSMQVFLPSYHVPLKLVASAKTKNGKEK